MKPEIKECYLYNKHLQNDALQLSNLSAPGMFSSPGRYKESSKRVHFVDILQKICNEGFLRAFKMLLL